MTEIGVSDVEMVQLTEALRARVAELKAHADSAIRTAQTAIDILRPKVVASADTAPLLAALDVMSEALRMERDTSRLLLDLEHLAAAWQWTVACREISRIAKLS